MEKLEAEALARAEKQLEEDRLMGKNDGIPDDEKNEVSSSAPQSTPTATWPTPVSAAGFDPMIL